MAGGEHLLVQESAVPVVSSGADPSPAAVRLAHFLHPRAGGGQRPLLPPPPRNAGPILADELQVEFKGWAESPNLWTRWVAKLRPRCEPLWRKLGIQDAVLATAYRVRRDEGAMLQLAAIWSAETNTFVFPWGEATVTLEDVAVLGGLPLLGRPVRAPLKGSPREDVEALEGVRRALYRSDSQKPDHRAWAMPFLEPSPGEGPAAGDGDAAGLLEHGAFLAMWLSLFVLPAPPFGVVRAEVLPVAARLARGSCVALGPAALASIYRDLSALNRYINLDKRYQPFVGWAPLHILQLWVLARFPELRPEMATTTLDPLARHQPWAARWHHVHKVTDPIDVHRVFMSPREFEWRPYGSSTFAPSPKKSCSWVHGRDMARSIQLLSFAQCLRACELVGMRCIEQYNPHRVARQLGFDQDVPGSVARVNSDWKIAWGTYFMEPSNFAFIVPQYMLAVTFEYAQWWKPYAFGCDTAIDNNVNSKEFPVLVSPRDKNMAVLHDGNSGKKQHVLPGMSPPDTFEVFFSRLNTFEVSQTDIPLVENNGLDTIQGTVEHLAEGAESAQIANDLTLRCVRKGTKTKSVKLASPDKKAVLVSAVDESSWVSVMEQGMPRQHSKDEAPNVFAKQNSSSEHGEVALCHLVKRAVSTTNRKAIGATMGHVQPSVEDIVVILDEEFDESMGKELEVGATVGHVQPSLEDIMVISDEEFDESVGKEHEVGAIPMEGNEKANKDASTLNQQSDSLMEDCIAVNRKSSGNNEMCSSNPVDANPELIKRVISTKTLYYLRPFGPVKDAQDRVATGTITDQGAYLPRREVGTSEMIEEASAAREAEKVVLQKAIDSLKEEIAAAQTLLRL